MSRAALLLPAALLVAACGGPSPWTDLSSVSELEEAFNRDADRVRLVLLLSPT